MRAPQKTAPRQASAPAQPMRDMRQDFLNLSNLRNDIEVFQFNQDEAGFGAGSARIIDVWMEDATGERCAWIIGGETISLHIACAISAPIQNPVVGFMVTNAYGQQLFGDNTWLAQPKAPQELAPGDILETTFRLQMPILAQGEYYVAAAIGEGSPQSHIQHHWRHEALIFTSHSSSLASGLVGAPMLAIEMQRRRPAPPPG